MSHTNSPPTPYEIRRYVTCLYLLSQMADIIQTLQDIDDLNIAKSVKCDINELPKYYKPNNSNITIISQNIRSIYCNFDDFLANLSILTFECDIIILTECRLNINKPVPELNKYNSYFTSCQLNQNDGVVVYVKKTLKCKVVEIHLAQASCLKLDILNNSILCIYRSPKNHNAENFINSLSSHLDTLNRRKNIIITGDININITQKYKEQSNEYKNRTNYLNMLSNYGILPGHYLPTREKNCLDHMMLKIDPKKCSAFIAVLNTTITDHLTTFLSVDKINTAKHLTQTSTTKINFENALQYLKNSNLSELLSYNDPNQITDLLINKLLKSMTENTSIIFIPKKQRTIKPWITPGLLKCIRNRNKLQKQSKDDPYNEVKGVTYVRYRNFCNNLLKKLKRKYESKLLTNSLNNNKLLWKNIKNVTHTINKNNKSNNELTQIKSSPKESVNYINDYFANIGILLVNNVQCSVTNDDQNKYLNTLSRQPQSFTLLDTDLNEVQSLIANLKVNSAPGWDNISTTYLKYVSYEVTPIITHLTNLCFKTGIFPNSLKRSIITPVFKSGERHDINNYRPISVLPALSKILEKILNNRLIKYLTKFNIISQSQFGFRQGISTEDAVISLTTILTKQLDVGKKCLAVFLDLKKAFDTVSFSILVRKLEQIGIRGIQLSIFKDYLTNRKQRVKLDEECISEDISVSCGIPQGSVLGPTLFLIYVNDLCNMNIKNAKIFSYADDTAIVFSGTSWAETKVYTEQGLAQISKWLKNNLLTLNTSKTHYLCCSIKNQRQPKHDFQIKIHSCDDIKNNKACNCPLIDKVDQIKYLGVIVDQRLSWYPQIEQISLKIRKFNWMFRSLRHLAPTNIRISNTVSKNLLNQIYTTLVQSVIVYCIPVWGGAYKSHFIEVERAQRALLKIMYFKKKCFPTSDLYQVSEVLSVRKLYILHTILKIHKTINKNLVSLTKRRKAIIAPVPITKTVFAGTQFANRSPYLYNKINKLIDIYSKTYHVCKKNLIEYLAQLNYEETESILQFLK